MREGSDFPSRAEDMAHWFKEFYWPYQYGTAKEVRILPLSEQYFAKAASYSSLRKGDWRFVIVLMSVGLLILIFAVINYINLTVAQAGFRAKEMATRRLLGSSRGELFMRLMLESTLLTFISLIIGVLLALAVVPFVNDLLQTRVDMNVLGRDFVAFLLYVNLFMKPLLRLTVFTEMYQRGMAGFQRFYEIMEMQPEIIDNKNAIDCVQIRGEIEFDNLVFGYSEQRKVIKGFNLKITPGQTVAFVGETGAGKTTIASLLLRFYEPLSGKILIDGIDIRQYKQQELRRNIGIVQQDVFLFSDSVTHNIAYAKPEAGQKEVEKAARMAAADRFIQELPDKYDTEIGERGVKLSGGQKQRLAIARVFLKNPPIVILDEATSSLDNHTEKLIQESLDRLAENRTTLIIAHRMSTIKNADKIIVLNNGEVAEIGTHSTLMSMGGLYYNLYNAQKYIDDK